MVIKGREGYLYGWINDCAHGLVSVWTEDRKDAHEYPSNADETAILDEARLEEKHIYFVEVE